MDNIIEPNPSFDFSQIGLAQPVALQGGAYFTKILLNNKSLYIQTPKSLSRQGFVKSGKKIHCDLMFDNTNGNFIQWIENLEQKCQDLIYEKSDSWFQNTLEKDDIESAFNTSLKVFKSGKFYLLRTNIKTNSLNGTPIIKIFNENESIMHMDEVTSETNMVSIIEIQGIKFTSRNFQIEMELKQVMVLNTEEIFESCLIKKGNTQQIQTPETIQKPLVILQTKKEETKSSTQNDLEKETKSSVILNNIETLDTLDTLESVDIDKINETTSKIMEDLDLSEVVEETKPELNIKTEVEPVNKDNIEIEVNDLDLKEFDLSEETNANTLETMTLKKPNQVYYEIYKEARKKAKEAKQAAVLAYLEAKNIKKTYMLEDIDLSDESDMSEFSDNDEEDESDLDENEEIEAEILE